MIFPEGLYSPSVVRKSGLGLATIGFPRDFVQSLALGGRNTSRVSLDPMVSARECLGCQYSIGKQSRHPDRYGLYHFRRSPERMGSDG